VRVGQTYSDNLKIVVMISKIKLKGFLSNPIENGDKSKLFWYLFGTVYYQYFENMVVFKRFVFSNGTYDEFI
jgi:LEA14-like dessication related protein